MTVKNIYKYYITIYKILYINKTFINKHLLTLIMTDSQLKCCQDHLFGFNYCSKAS